MKWLLSHFGVSKPLISASSVTEITLPVYYGGEVRVYVQAKAKDTYKPSLIGFSNSPSPLLLGSIMKIFLLSLIFLLSACTHPTSKSYALDPINEDRDDTIIVKSKSYNAFLTNSNTTKIAVVADYIKTVPRLMSVFIRIANKGNKGSILQDVYVKNSLEEKSKIVSPEYYAWSLYPGLGREKQMMDIPPPTITSYNSFSTLSGNANYIGNGNYRISGMESTVNVPSYDYTSQNMAIGYDIGVAIHNGNINAQDTAREKSIGMLRAFYLKLGAIPPGKVRRGLVIFTGDYLSDEFTVSIRLDGKEYKYPFVITNRIIEKNENK